VKVKHKIAIVTTLVGYYHADEPETHVLTKMSQE